MASANRTALDRLLASVRFENSALDPLLQQLSETPYQNVPAELVEPADQLERPTNCKGCRDAQRSRQLRLRRG